MEAIKITANVLIPVDSVPGLCDALGLGIEFSDPVTNTELATATTALCERLNSRLRDDQLSYIGYLSRKAAEDKTAELRTTVNDAISVTSETITV